MADELQSIGEHGEQMNVQTLREQWGKSKAYCVAPQGAQIMLHALVAAGQYNTKTVEDARLALAKLAEVLEAVWPIGTPKSIDIIRYGQATIHVPKEIGEATNPELRFDPEDFMRRATRS